MKRPDPEARFDGRICPLVTSVLAPGEEMQAGIVLYNSCFYRRLHRTFYFQCAKLVYRNAFSTFAKHFWMQCFRLVLLYASKSEPEDTLSRSI